MNQKNLQWKSWLSSLLVFQLALAIGLFWHNESQQQQHKQTLVSFEHKQPDRIVIHNNEDKHVEIKKSDQSWELPDLQQLPANPEKLNSLISKLESLNAGWPVATTASSHKRFEVDEENFQRRIELFQDKTLLAELFVGTSPGFRKVHIRKVGEDNIYAVKLNTYDLPVDSNDWLDKSLLSAQDITKIKGPDYALNKKDENWAFAPVDQQAEDNKTELNTEKAQELVSALNQLNIRGISDKPINTDKANLSLQVSSPKNDWTYEFIKQGDRYYVRRNDRDTAFEISQYDYDRISQIDHNQLAASNTPQTEEGDKNNENKQSNS